VRLDDIDWHHGELLVRGKGRRDDRMPLPADVGEALADYLMRSRPADAPKLRTVFMGRPRRPMDRVTVLSMVARVGARAGLDAVGAHRLRHSLGEAMIRAEVPLTSIGQVLRHHDPLTTAARCRRATCTTRSARPPPGRGCEPNKSSPGSTT
jgi:integrase/recombinase XerD